MAITKKIRILIVLIFVSSAYLTASAQVSLDSVYSQTLKENRHLHIRLPENYKAGSTEKYDVLYLLDGDWNIDLIGGIQKYLHQWEFTPNLIIVGIDNIYINGNNQRGRDLTPAHTNSQASGGAANFLTFIKDELIPYIDKTYSTTGSNTLFGHSLGGLFVMYALLSAPGSFDSYIAADPSFFWDHHFIHQLASAKLPAIRGLKTLFITGREGKQFHEMQIDAMDTILQKAAPTALHWKIQAYTDETHVSAQFKSAYDGLKYSYTGYKPYAIQFTPMNGTVLKNRPYKVGYDESVARVGYTTDGSQPTENAFRMTDTLVLQGPSHLTISTLCYHPRYNQITSGLFTEGQALPASPKPKGLPGGLHYAYYEGDWNGLPPFKQLRPLRSGNAGIDIDIDSLKNERRFALLVNGQLEIKEDGYYTFVFSTDDAGAFYLADKLLVKKSAGGLATVSYMVPLVKGFYPLSIEYLHRKGEYNINLTWLTPKSKNGDDPSSIPLSQLYPVSK